MKTRIAFVLVTLLASPVAPAAAAPLVLKAYNEAGTLLTTQAFLARTSAAPAGWRNDLLYHVSDGGAAAHLPVVDVGGLPGVEISGGGLGLAVAWSTAGTGYSTLFLDNQGAGLAAGSVVFNELAARDIRFKLTGALARRPDYVPSAAFTDAVADADALLTAVTGTAVDAEKGTLAQQALDRLVRAFEILLRDYGRDRARAAALDEWWGFTVDRLNNNVAVLDSIADLTGNDAGRGVVRIVFDEGVAATEYDGIVTAAHSAGLRVMGEILDSFPMDQYTLAEFEARVREYVDHFPSIEIWEIGNEVNGEWLGPQVAEKIAYAADYVKSVDPSDKTVLTFYWQMGTAGGPATTMFEWIRNNVTPSMKADIDTVSLSAWIGDAPLGVAHDEVYERLHALFPTQRIVMGELGYWSPATTKAWWWRSQVDPTGTVRRALADQMYLANFAFPYADGGVFWWNYNDEMSGRGALWQTVRNAYRSIHDCDDADGDMACDWDDNCPALANADQADDDGDGLGDVCDLSCPSGDPLSVSKLTIDLRDGAADRLALTGVLTASLAFDPVADGVGLRVENDGIAIVDTTVGGPGAPAAFTLRSTSWLYNDRTGAASGIQKMILKPVRNVPGGYKLTIKGRDMDLGSLTNANARVQLDLTAGCAETRADEVSCEFRNAAKLLCR
jgi:hypothetical protein